MGEKIAVDRYRSDWIILINVRFGRDITPSQFRFHFHVQSSIAAQIGNVQLRIHNLNIAVMDNIARFYVFLSLYIDL